MGIEKTRILLSDSMTDVIIKMAGGNPGAINSLMQMIKEVPQIDPQNAMGGLGTILSLDSFGIYEERIWVLYNDVCKQDMTNMIACLRACQLGFISQQDLNDSINGNISFVLSEILQQVQESLSEFGKK